MVSNRRQLLKHLLKLGGTLPFLPQVGRAQYSPFAFWNRKTSNMKVHMGSFDSTTSIIGTDIAVTGAGFQPKAIIFFANGRSELLDLKSMDSNGFTLTVDQAFSSNRKIHYMALGGNTLEQAYIGNFQEPGSTGTFDITSVGFQPDCVLFLSIGRDEMNNHASVQYLNFGAATSSDQFTTGIYREADSGGGQSSGNYGYSGQVWSNFFRSTMTSRISFDSFLSNGMRLNCLERSGYRYVYFMALKGGQYKISNFQTRTDTSDIVVTGHSAVPQGGLVLSCNKPMATNDTPDLDSNFSLGAFTSTGHRLSIGESNEDFDNPNRMTTNINYETIYSHLNYDGTTRALMDLVSLQSNGFTCKMETADNVANDIFSICFGDN